MNSNPFQPVYDACNRGDSRYKLAHLPEFPRLIDIELTNTCNFRCLMCPTGNHSMKRSSGMMSEVVYYKVLEEIAPHRTPLRFIRWGEPTLHPRLLEFLAVAKERGLLLHLNTNGSKLDRELMEALIEVGLDSLKFSFQGVDRNGYAEMRSIDFFEELGATIREFHRLRGERRRPYLCVSTTITYETPEQVHHFLEEMRRYADEVNVGRTMLEQVDLALVRLPEEKMAALRRLKAEESVLKHHPECPEVFDKLSINWDGSVTACCGDADNLMRLGTVTEGSLIGLWRSPEMARYRELLAEMRHDELPLCRHCYDTHGLHTPGLEKIMVRSE